MGENGKTWEWLIDFFKESQKSVGMPSGFSRLQTVTDSVF